MVADLVGVGLETLRRFDELAALCQEGDQRLGIHLARAAGMKTGICTEVLIDRLLEAGTGKLPPCASIISITS